MANGYSTSTTTVVTMSDLYRATNARMARGFATSISDGGYERVDTREARPHPATCSYCRRETTDTAKPCEGCGAAEFIT